MEKTSNTDKWKEALTGISNHEAFKLINIQHKELTQKQREALWGLWGKIQKEKWHDPKEWAKEEMPTKEIQERLMNLPSRAVR